MHLEWSFHIFVLVIINIPASTVSNCIHQQLDGKLRQSEINFSMIIRDFNGIIFYGRDIEERLLMKIERSSTKDASIVIQNNYFSAKRNVKDLCGCEYCSMKYLTVLIRIGDNNIVINCNDQKNSYTWTDGTSIDPDKFRGLPITNSSAQYVNKTFIWMGNIGPFVDHNNITYYPIKDQLTGCLQYFYFNNQPIYLTNNGKYFVSPCYKKVIKETVCDRSKCSTKTIPIDILKCDILNTNDPFCMKDKYRSNLMMYDGKNYSYIKQDSGNQRSVITLLWKQMFSNNYCLMEIIFRDGQVLVVSVSSTNYITMYFLRGNENNYPAKLLNKISINEINLLQMIFVNDNLILKIISEDIHVYIERPYNQPRVINVGRSDNATVCQIFEGAIDFRYNTSQFRLNNSNELSDSTIKADASGSSKTKFIIIGVIGVLLLSLAALVFFYFIVKREINSKLNQSQPEAETRLTYEVVKDIYEISSPIRDSAEYSVIPD